MTLFHSIGSAGYIARPLVKAVVTNLAITNPIRRADVLGDVTAGMASQMAQHLPEQPLRNWPHSEYESSQLGEEV